MNIKRIGIVAAVGAAAVAIGTGIAAAQPDAGEGTPITGDALTKARPRWRSPAVEPSPAPRSATRRATTRWR
jgi:hypothetical protein